MEKGERVFISDQLFSDSSGTTKLQKALAFFAGIVLIISGILGINTHKSGGTIIIPIIQLFSGIVLATFDIVQTVFYKKFGKLYVRFLENQLEIRIKHFQPPIQINYAEIDHIKFQLSKILIFLKSQKNGAIKISLPFSKVEEMRDHFRKFAQKNSIQLSE
ncbi:hypothetical protein B6D60_00670 [candidate division KSB1 bacterium 4484_87]|nr:MAG: hypothetical protein B6D60_00670 [candidate division KSB1 bacterium 4484_87]